VLYAYTAPAMTMVCRLNSLCAEIEDPRSALHTSCVAMRAAGTRLLGGAQAAGVARTDIDGADLFAPASSLAWLGDQPGPKARTGHLIGVVVSAILTNAGSSDAEEEAPPSAP
jgi:hypothetical protein